MAAMITNEYLLDLPDAIAPSEAGAKAANLARLIAAGFPIPDGVVLTAAFVERLASDGALPPHLAAALDAVTRRFGDIPLAVRSSGVAEDLPGASYAGQYETVLDIRGREALLEAVRRCAASASAERVLRYRAEHGEAGPAPLAVLVQRLVAADAAGVAFSANPVTGDRTEIVVSAVRGLGERLVSGAANPDEWVVRGTRATAHARPEQAIDAADALRIAQLARRVERHFGSPQDIEWAIAGGALYLLQARPITTLPAPAGDLTPAPVEVPEGFWEREASHYPKPLSPMSRSIFLPAVTAGLAHMFREFGFMADGLDYREIGGWVYARLMPPGGKDRKAPPPWLMRLLLRVVPDLRRRTRASSHALGTDLAGRLIDRWYGEWHPAFTAEIEAIRGLDLRAMSDEELQRHLERVHAFASADAADAHFMLHGALGLMLSQLGFACRDLLGWDAARTFDLLNGLSERSTEPAHRLAELARLAHKRPAIRALLERPDAEAATRLRAVDAEFADAFEAYQRQYGCRAIRYELAEPTIEETPELVLSLLRDQIATGYDPEADAVALASRREAAASEARHALASRPAERERFERLLERGRRAYPVREDNEFFTISAPLALLRYAAHEVGRRLAERGQVAERDDVFFLEWEEARAALRDSAPRQLVRRRRGEREWAEAHPGPASYGTPPPAPPPLDVLPPDSRFAMEALLWTMEQIFGAPVSQSVRPSADGGTHGVRGIPASAGTYTGAVRVVMDETEFHKIRPGDVLVCPITSPVWSVVFPSIGALVTDTGGVLSHPAIIAREYRVPAVVATGDVTTRLRDGQTVTVDGAAGTVTVVMAAPPL